MEKSWKRQNEVTKINLCSKADRFDGNCKNILLIRTIEDNK